MNKNYTTRTIVNNYDILNSKIEIEVIEYLIAENKVFEILENRSSINSEGKISREMIVQILSSSYDYENAKSNAIIDSMIGDYLIEPDGKYLQINQLIKHADNLWIINPDK